MYHHGTKMFGTFRANPKLLKDVGLIHRFMSELIEAIGMTTLGTHVYDVPMAVKRLGAEPLNDEGGVTAVTVLSTSHAAIHTWPEDSGARFDVDSCRDFDTDTVLEVIRRVFDAGDVKWQVARMEP